MATAAAQSESRCVGDDDIKLGQFFFAGEKGRKMEIGVRRGLCRLNGNRQG